MHGILIILLIIIAIFLGIPYYFYAMESIDFTENDALLILIFSGIGGFIDIPIFTTDNVTLAVNVGGALIPLLIAIKLIYSKREYAKYVAGIALVAFFAYAITEIGDGGITAPFPYWLLPPVMASMYSLIVSKNAPSVAYVSGVIGVIIGADILHLPDIFSMQFPEKVVASIGGASIFDMIYIAGMLAVVIDLLMYRFVYSIHNHNI